MSKALRSYNIQANLEVGEKLSDYQVKNSTGGFVYQVSDQARLERFLILGTDGGTYYASEKDLTKQNVDWLKALIQKDSALVLNVLFDVSVNGRAYSNSAALFALAMVLAYGDDETKSRAAYSGKAVARTATHVYELAQYIENLGGWGRAKRRTIANWFTSQSPERLAYQAVKYRQRNGWTLRDLMRLSHPVGVNQNVGNFILGKVGLDEPEILVGFRQMQTSSTVDGVINNLNVFPNLPWETIPTQFLKEPKVWKTLFHNGQLKGQALVRNVTRLARIGAFEDMSFVGEYARALSDESMIQQTRLHPMQFANAYIVYDEGQLPKEAAWGYGNRTKSWTTNARIKDALQAGFYASFKNVTPSNKAVRIGVDVSGSMSWSAAGSTDMTAAQAAALMSMIIARTEPHYEIVGFSSTLKDLGISAGTSLSEAMKKVQNHNFGATNPSLLISSARNSGAESFIVITDNEVNQGAHPSQALNEYRRSTGIDAKLIVMGMTATNFTIADPSDPGMLDVVGFDSNAPKVVSDFMSGKI